MNIYHVSVGRQCYRHVIHAFISVLTLSVLFYSFLCCALCVCVCAPYTASS